MVNLKNYTAFVVAYVVVMVIFVYTIRLPQIITRNYELVHEYYFANKIKSFFTDLVFIVLYWLFAYVVWTVLKIKSQQGQFVVLIGSSIFLTSAFWFYFTRQPYHSAHFFNRWFHTVGLRSAVYDAVLFGILFVVYHGVLNVLNR
jgi:hypothetical protein